MGNLKRTLRDVLKCAFPTFLIVIRVGRIFLWRRTLPLGCLIEVGRHKLKFERQIFKLLVWVVAREDLGSPGRPIDSNGNSCGSVVLGGCGWPALMTEGNLKFSKHIKRKQTQIGCLN